MFSMYVEQKDGSYKEGEYFPGVTYELNYDKTSCVDNKKNNVSNDIVTYTNGKLTLSSSKTIFCYLYFENEAKTYAIYSDTDNSLTFYKNKDSEGIGSKYNNKNVTAIYSGFENIGYSAEE